MKDNDLKREARKQKRLEGLGTANPRCSTCGENRWQCLELHHVAGRKADATVVLECRNCHRVLSDDQHDHPAFKAGTDRQLSTIGHFLLGLADMLRIIIEKLYEFGLALIARAETGDAS